MAPFLEIITRHYAKRPGLMRDNRASLIDQTCGDWQQTVLIDRVGVGVPGANAMLAEYASQVRGKFAWVLDDDDECINANLVARLKEIDAEQSPDVIMLKMDHGPWGVLPPDELWGKPPKYSQIGSSAFVVRRELWHEYGDNWRRNVGGDYGFISAVWQSAPKVAWYEEISSRVRVASSHGRTEAQLARAGMI